MSITFGFVSFSTNKSCGRLIEIGNCYRRKMVKGKAVFKTNVQNNIKEEEEEKTLKKKDWEEIRRGENHCNNKSNGTGRKLPTAPDTHTVEEKGKTKLSRTLKFAQKVRDLASGPANGSGRKRKTKNGRVTKRQ